VRSANGEPKVVFRNGHYLIAVKPRGLPVHPTRDPNRANLLDQVRALLHDDDPDRSIALPHRLDVWTSGLVVFGLSDASAKALGNLFENRFITKRYRAICAGCPREPSGELRHYLAKRRVEGIDQMISVRSGGKVAIASYQLDSFDPETDTSVITFELVTGRMHQLRVQAAESGWPILGDQLYGDPVRNRAAGVDGQLLHAEHLSFDDPIQGIPIDVSTPPPLEFDSYLAETPT